MDKIIFLLVGVAIGVAICLLWPREQQPALPEPAVIVEKADAVQTLDLSTVPQDLVRAAGVTKPRLSIEYPDTALNLLLYEPSPELGKVAGRVLPQQTIIAYPDSSIPYAALEEPPPDLFKVTLPRPFVSHPDTAVVFIVEQPTQELITSAAQVKPHPLVEYPDAGWSGSLSPPVGLLTGRR